MRESAVDCRLVLVCLPAGTRQPQAARATACSSSLTWNRRRYSKSSSTATRSMSLPGSDSPRATTRRPAPTTNRERRLLPSRLGRASLRQSCALGTTRPPSTTQDRSQLGSCRHGPRDELREGVRWPRQTSRGPGSPHPTAQRLRGSPTPQAPRRRRKRRYAVSMSRKRRRIVSKSARLMGSLLRANSAGERRDAIRVNWSRKYCCTDSPAAAACSRSRFPTSSSRPFTFKSMATIIPIWYHICRPSITSGYRHPRGSGSGTES